MRPFKALLISRRWINWQQSYNYWKMFSYRLCNYKGATCKHFITD